MTATCTPYTEAVEPVASLQDMQQVLGRWWRQVGYSEDNVQLTLQVYESLYHSSGGKIHPLADWYPQARVNLWVLDHGQAVDADALQHLLQHPSLPVLPEKSIALMRWELGNGDPEEASSRPPFPPDPGLAQEWQRYREVQAEHSVLLRKLLWQERVVQVLGLQKRFYRLPPRLPLWVKSHFELPTETLSRDQLQVLSARPYQLIDRAVRNPAGWTFQDLPRYPGTVVHGLQLEYQQQGSSLQELEQLIYTLDPRTGDVWRLLLAMALEQGEGGMYRTLTLDLRDLGKGLGFKPHPRGGLRPRQLLEIAQSLAHLERLWLTVTPEARTLEPDTGQPRRQYRPLQGQRTLRVLAVMAKDQPRQLDGQTFYLRWHLALGEWSRLFERSHARIFRSLLALPLRPAASMWAKHLGTELAYLYREDRQPDPERPDHRRKWKTLTVRRLLERCCLLEETEALHGQGHHNRAIKRFEEALDLLARHGVHQGWHYHPQDAARIDEQVGKPGAFACWLQARVLIEAPEAVLKIYPLPYKKPRTSGR